MKFKSKLIISELGDEFVAVPVGGEEKNLLIRLNATGADICRALIDGKSEEEAAAVLLEKYDGVDMDKALTAVRGVVEKLRNEGLLTED